ncbi:MAG: GTPase [Clostridia bacterium]|nr:GTPase [Clostridia bacterium]
MANRNRREEPIPVYLITGFLESGKTTFIQEILSDPRNNRGEMTLLLTFEEGEVEYDFSEFSSGDVSFRTIGSEDEMTPEALLAIDEEEKPERVFIEYNGMWLLDALFAALPDNWAVVQEITVADAQNYATYNANMRNLVYDKLKSCEAVLFNRVPGKEAIPALHKLVRQSSRRCNISYEFRDGTTVPDEIEDPLPYDLSSPVVKIEDRDYAYFISDLFDNPENYIGKTVEFLALAASGPKFPAGMCVVGRQLMNCCAADIQFAGIAGRWSGASDFGEDGVWLRVTGEISVDRCVMYNGKGPILTIRSIKPAKEPEDPVATFY